MSPPRDPYQRTTHDGNTVNWRTKAMLLEMERRLGYELSVSQGSYNSGVSASAGTHDGGGAVDLSAFDWKNKVHAGRAVGFAMWHRPAIAGLWPEHIHGIAIGDKEMSSGAAAQVVDYRNHRDGLASHARDDTWHPDPIPNFDYAKWRENQMPSVNDILSAKLNPDEPAKSETVRSALNKAADALDQVKSLAEAVDKLRDGSAQRDKAIRQALAELDAENATAEQVQKAKDQIIAVIGGRS